MEFVNVIDVHIPEGDVIKIAETSGGRVLWEKKKYPDLSPFWLSPIRSTKLDSNVGDLIKEHLIRSISVDRDAGKISYYIVVTAFNNQGVEYQDRYGTGFSLNGYANSGFTIVEKPTSEGELKSIIAVSDRTYQSISGAKGGINIFKRSSDSFVKVARFDLVSPFVRLPHSVSVGDEVWIAYSKERGEYLITERTKPTQVVSDTLSGVSVGDGTKIARAKYVEELHKYFGALGTSSGKVALSSDGLGWTSVNVFSGSSYTLGVEWLSEKHKLCAISSNSNQIAISSDGVAWEIRTAPFSQAVAYAYSPEYDALCVIGNNYSYITRDLNSWGQFFIPSANREARNFRRLVHIKEGIFVGYVYKGKYAYFLSLGYDLEHE